MDGLLVGFPFQSIHDS